MLSMSPYIAIVMDTMGSLPYMGLFLYMGPRHYMLRSVLYSRPMSEFTPLTDSLIGSWHPIVNSDLMVTIIWGQVRE